MFIGREKELKSLNDAYLSDNFEFFVIYGRRRVGKTTLLRHFCNGKKSIFFVAEEYNDKTALEKFSETILSYFNLNNYISTFETWEKAFMFLYEKAIHERIILVIDELPYIVNSNKSIISLLQNMTDKYFLNSKLFIILCGSSVSFMENEVLGHKSPLFGRRTGQLKIEPFGFYDSCKFMEKYSMEEKVISYGILGGIPQYLKKFNYNLSIEENIKNNFLDKSSYLFEEPRLLIKQELREPSLYNSIIEAIALGSSKLNEIATKISENTDKTAKYIKVLIDLNILEKETPVIEKESSKKSIYRIKDNLFCFWFRFVFNNIGLIEQEMIDFIYKNKIETHINQYLGYVFEKICIEYMHKINKAGTTGFVFENIGRWWGNNRIEKREEEIDILAYSGENAIFGECKWQNEKMGIGVYEGLVKKSLLMQDFKNREYYLFSKTGFKEELIKLSGKDKKTHLVSLEDLFKINI